MSNQGSLFHTGTANREEAVPVQARLLSRREDPVSSHQAAMRLVESGRLTAQQGVALSVLSEYGSGTTWEVAGRLANKAEGYRPQIAERFHYMLARRLPELERKGLVRVQQDPAKPCRCKPGAKRCRCRDVVRDGSRVWEAVA